MANKKKKKVQLNPHVALPSFSYKRKKANGGALTTDVFSAGANIAADLVDTFVDEEEGREVNLGKRAVSGALSGAATGAKLGSILPGPGTAIGTAVGTVAGGIGGYIAGQKEQEATTAALRASHGRANGGFLNPHELAMGGDIEEINGPTHEEGGVDMGPNAEVEGGEVKVADYIFSDRLGMPDSKKTFADEAKKIKKKYELRDDDITKRSQEAELTKLMQANEVMRMEQEAKEQAKAEAQAPQVQPGMEDVPQGTPEFADGGPLSDSTSVDDFKFDLEQPLESLSKLPEANRLEDRRRTELPILPMANPDAELNMPVYEKFALGGPTSSRRGDQIDMREIAAPKMMGDAGQSLYEANIEAKMNSHMNNLDDLYYEDNVVKRHSETDKGGKTKSKRALGGPLDELNKDLAPLLDDPNAVENAPFLAESRDVGKASFTGGPKLDRNNLPIFEDSPLKKLQSAKHNYLDSKPDGDGLGGDEKSFGNEEKALLASSLPAMGNMIRGMKPEVTKFDRVKPATISLQGQRDSTDRDLALARRINRENARGSGRSSGAVLSSLATGNSAITETGIKSKMQSYMSEENTNTQIRNQANQTNTSIANNEIIANEQNRAMAATLKGMGMTNMSDNYQGYIKDKKLASENVRQNDRLMSMINATFPNYNWEDDNGDFAIKFANQLATKETNAYGGYVLPKI